MLTKNQFLVINELRKSDSITAQSQLADRIGLSVGTVNSIVRELRASKWMEGRGFALTKKGLKQLEPYRVDNAIIMAAGFSSHFAPVSFERPKGLLTVRDEVLIERQIRQLHEAGITDITVVVGYMKELFFYLGEKFGVDIVVNEEYTTRDNHSSLYRVRDRLARTYICSSDNYFTENVFEPFAYEAYYAATYAEGYTEEWCMEVKAHDVISKVSIGGSDSWFMLGHVFFDQAFSDGMRAILEAEYDLPVTRNKLWEQLFIDHITELRMVMRRYPAGVIFEFDSLADLHEFDSSFINNVDSRILDNIAEVLKCERSQIVDISPIKLGSKNLSCKFMVNGSEYVYRHPDVFLSEHINHASEAFSRGVAHELGIDSVYIYEDPKEGWSISRFIRDCEHLNYHDHAQIARLMELIRKLHDSGISSPWEANLNKNVEKAIMSLAQHERTAYTEFKEMHEDFERIISLVDSDHVPACLCHNDLIASNLLVHDGHIDVIDWEYSGMGDYGDDIASLICCCPDYEYDDVLEILRLYFKREPSPIELRHCIGCVALASFRHYVWALYRDMLGFPEGSLLYTWYRHAREYAKRALALYAD